MRLAALAIILLATCSTVLPAEEVTFKGTFTWNGLKKPFDLICILTPDGDQLAANYVAKWNDKKDHPYVGSFAADKKTGAMTGKASVKGTNDYTVRGKLEGDTFTAEFFKLKKGKEVSDGTFTLKRADTEAASGP